MAFQTLIRQAYFEMPPVTRAYTTACVLTTMSVQLDLLSPFQLYFNPILVWKNYQLWRLMTTFLFFGTFGFNFFFNMIFTYRYCRMLEENSFRGRTADFVTMFIFGSVFMIFAALFVNLLFLGKSCFYVLNLMNTRLIIIVKNRRIDCWASTSTSNALMRFVNCAIKTSLKASVIATLTKVS